MNSVESNKKKKYNRQHEVNEKLLIFDLIPDNQIFNKNNSLNLNDIFKKLEPFLKQNKEEKCKKELKGLIVYLSQLNKYVELLKLNSFDSSNEFNQMKYEELFTSLALKIKFKSFKKDRKIIKTGDKGDKFYIILNGQISVCVPHQITINLTIEEYEKYLAKLIMYEEYDLLFKVLIENREEYNIVFKDISLMNDENYRRFLNYNFRQKRARQSFKLHFSRKNTTTIEENQPKTIYVIKEFLDKNLTKEEKELFYNIRSNDCKLEEDDGFDLTTEDYIKRIEVKKNKKINDLTPISNKENFLFSSNSSLCKTFKIYEYIQVTTLNRGDCFGEIALNKPNEKRTASLISTQDCFLGYIDKEAYVCSLRASNERIKEARIGALNKFESMKEIGNRELEIKYLNYFVDQQIFQNDCLLHESMVNKNIYFLKSGSFEININCNHKILIEVLFRLYNTYFDFIEKTGMNYMKNNMESSKENDDFLKNSPIRSILLKISAQQKILSIVSDPEFEKKYTLKVLILNSPSIIGLKEMERFNKNNNYQSIFDIKCLSKTGEYFSINKNIFYNEIYKKNLLTKYKINEYIVDFMEKLITRLIHLRYGLISNYIKKFWDLNDQLKSPLEKQSYYNILDSYIDNRLISNSFSQKAENFLYSFKEKEIETKVKNKNLFKMIKENKAEHFIISNKNNSEKITIQNDVKKINKSISCNTIFSRNKKNNISNKTSRTNVYSPVDSLNNNHNKIKKIIIKNRSYLTNPPSVLYTKMQKLTDNDLNFQGRLSICSPLIKRSHKTDFKIIKNLNKIRLNKNKLEEIDILSPKGKIIKDNNFSDSGEYNDNHSKLRRKSKFHYLYKNFIKEITKKALFGNNYKKCDFKNLNFGNEDKKRRNYIKNKEKYIINNTRGHFTRNGDIVFVERKYNSVNYI